MPADPSARDAGRERRPDPAVLRRRSGPGGRLTGEANALSLVPRGIRPGGNGLADHGGVRSPDDDRRLMEAVRAGSREAFGLLLDRYWSDLVRYASTMTGRADDAQDVVQECFIRVWRKRESWRASGSVAGYLYRITRNLALNAKRDLGVLRSGEAEFGARTNRRSGPEDPHQVLVSRRLGARVREAIEALPERRREVFVLARFHGLSHREIAEIMGISAQTVANQMSSAVSDLRARLDIHLPRQ